MSPKWKHNHVPSLSRKVKKGDNEVKDTEKLNATDCKHSQLVQQDIRYENALSEWNSLHCSFYRQLCLAIIMPAPAVFLKPVLCSYALRSNRMLHGTESKPLTRIG